MSIVTFRATKWNEVINSPAILEEQDEFSNEVSSESD